jgi:hypothetical protein
MFMKGKKGKKDLKPKYRLSGALYEGCARIIEPFLKEQPKKRSFAKPRAYSRLNPLSPPAGDAFRL